MSAYADDLVRWFDEQLDTDEQIARAAGGRSEHEWAADLSGKDPLGMPSWPVAVRYVTDGRLRGVVANLPVTNERSEDRMVHIAAHDPARVLREIDAKRQLLALHEPQQQPTRDSDIDDPSTFATCCSTCQVGVVQDGDWPCQTLRLLALPYSDRPGYHDQWRP